MIQEIGDSFVGRKQELKKIAEFLTADELGGLSFLGLPLSGRSRLLCEVERRAAPQKLQDKDQYAPNICAVRIECKESPNVIRWLDLLKAVVQRVCIQFEKHDFIFHLAREYEKAVWMDPPAAEDAEIKTWLGFFEDLRTRVPEFRIVFLLDDFDRCKPHEYPRSGSKAEWVTGWHFTRFVAYPSVGLITTSTHSIHQVEHFFRNFEERWLSPFTKEEVGDLIWANVVFSPSPKLREAIWRWAGGFPGLGCKLLKRHHAASPKLSRSEIAMWLRDDVGPWFDEVWGLLHPFEQQLLTNLASKLQFLAQWTGLAQSRFLAQKLRLKLCYDREKDVAKLLEEKGLVSLDGDWAQLAFEALRTLGGYLPQKLHQ